jgi:hypothetical protein
MKKENKVLFLIGIFVVFAVTLIVFFDKKMKYGEINLADNEDKLVFADVGHYGLTTAGNNNAVLETGDYIYSLPIDNPNITYNWLQIKNSVGNNITYNNFSGSYLHVDGNVKKMIFNYTSKNTGTATRQILIIFPNGEYTLETVTGDEGVIDITDKVTPNEADGWYYVSFINFDQNKYLAWGIEAVYENNNLPLRTVELYNLKVKLNNTSRLFSFNLNLDKNKNFKVVGAISSYDTVNTKAYGRLSNGSDYQFFERTANIFRGRDNVKFLKNQIDAERYPSRDLGGALDLFEQELSSSYIEGNTITGFLFENNSNIDVNILSFGILQDVYEPTITVDTEINAEERFKTNDTIKVIAEIKNNPTGNGVCTKTYNNVITTTVDSVLSNITNIKARYKGENLIATYSESDGLITVNTIDELDCSSPVDLTFEATINDTINNRLEGHIYKINNETKIIYDLIRNSNNRYPGSIITVKDNDTVSSLKRVLVTSTYTEKGTNNVLANPIVQELYFDDDYVTSESDEVSDNYELTSIPINYIGTRIENDIVVNYIYEIKKATITTYYLDSETGFELMPKKEDRKEYGEAYTTIQEEIPDYNFDYFLGVKEGTVKGDVEVTYYYMKKTGRVTVKHVDMATGENLEPPVTSTYKFHERYETGPKDIFLYYIYDSVEGIPSGEITSEDEIVVTYKYRKKEAQLYVYHLLDGTNEMLAPTVIDNEVRYGDAYTTTVSDQVPSNYELKTKTDNFAGFIKENRVEVYYYYQKKDSNLSTTITLDGTKTITSKSDKVTYNISYNATLSDYIGNGTITIIDTLPYKIDVNESELADGVYNDDNKTITWTISWDNINTYENRDSNTINKTIRVLYKDIDASNKAMINGVTGKITLDNNNREVTEKLKTDVLIPGTIVVHHYLVGTTDKVFEDEESTGLSGEIYISTAKYKEGYKLVTEKQSQTHTFKEERQEIVYEYKHLEYEIKVNNSSEEKGSVTGYEKVYYGENSKNTITITANDGYEIESIVVDGVEVIVTDKERMTLDTFKNVTTDHTVDVTFTEISIPVPITGKSNYIWIVAITLISIIGIAILSNLTLKKKD